jgi:hypothetical protein
MELEVPVMSKYICWLNTGKTPGDISLRAVSFADKQRFVWVNLPKTDALRLEKFTDEMRENFGRVSTTIDLEPVADRIERTKDGGRSLQLENFAELLRLAKATEVVQPDEPTAEDISAIADFFGSPAPTHASDITADPF